MQRTARRSPHWLFLLLMLAPACAVMKAQKGPDLKGGSRWVVLPFTNLAETARAGDKVASIATTLLRIHGVKDLKEYVPAANVPPEIDESPRLKNAIAWARNEGFVYGITGRVQEWRYRTGTDGEPAVGLSLAVIDIASGETVWAATGARSGWRQDTVSGTAQRLLGELLDQLDLH